MTKDLLKGARRLVAGLLVLLAASALVFVVSQALATLDALTRIENERDQWQRPSAVLDALGVTRGSVVADVGAGAGYFALKLGAMVGPNGQVLATDIRRLSLAFLWMRARRSGQWQVHAIHGRVDEPYLPAGAVDAVLIANTFHELSDPPAILAAVFRALKPGGRLVILDRGPRATADVSDGRSIDHELPLAAAEPQLAQAGFPVVRRDDHFIDIDGEDHVWWLLVAVKPAF